MTEYNDIYKKYVKGTFPNNSICLKITQNGNFINPAITLFSTRSSHETVMKDFEGNEVTKYISEVKFRKDQLQELIDALEGMKEHLKPNSD